MSTYNVKAHPAFAGYDIAEQHGGTTRNSPHIPAFLRVDEGSRAYRQAVFELNGLSDRDLADIGIARGDIQSIALQTAKAKVARR